MAKIKTFIFDSYGTLFNVKSLNKQLNLFFPGKGEAINQTWREKQVQYSFLRELMGKYVPFSKITKDALIYATKKHGVTLNPEQEIELHHSYLHLPLYPETKGVLSQLKDYQLAIFSDGSHDMLDPLVYNTGVSSSFHHVISVDEIKQYKPTPIVYRYAADVLNTKSDQVLYITSNGWDVSGAKNFGFHTAWINREHHPIEQLNLVPDAIYPDLTGVLHWV